MKTVKKVTKILSSNCVNKRLWCYDQWKKFFWQANEKWLKIYDNIRKIATGQGDDYTIRCLLDYPYFKKT